MAAKIGRPREPYRSKWQMWKRGQRDLPSKPGYVRHHLRKGTYGHPTRSNTVLIPRTEHPKHHAMRTALRRATGRKR